MNAQCAQVELPLANAMRELDASNRDGSRSEAL